MARKKSDPLILALDAQVIALLEESKAQGVEFKERLLAFREGVRYLQVKNKVEIDEPEGGIHELSKALNAGADHDRGRKAAAKARGGNGRTDAGSGGSADAHDIGAPAGPDFWGTSPSDGAHD